MQSRCCIRSCLLLVRGYSKADIHVIGNDSGQLAGNMMSNIAQIVEGFKGSTGIDLGAIASGMIGAKVIEKSKD